MVKINFKLTDKKQLQLEIKSPQPLETVLKLCQQQVDSPVGSVIVIRSEKVCGKQDLINPDDELDFYPALSGG